MNQNTTPIVKNKQYKMVIESLGSEGQGIGRIEQFAVFVEDALIGEEVEVLIIKVKKNYAVGKLLEIYNPSPLRTAPPCSVAKQCGGCQIMHLAYLGQLSFKQNKVEENLRRIGKLTDVSVLPTIGMEAPFYYRNKAQYPVGNENGKLAIGFYAKRSHRIIDTPKCMLQHKSNEEILQVIRAFLEEYHILPYDEQSHTGLVRHILTRVGFYTGEIMVCLVLTKNHLPNQDELIARLLKIKGMTSILINLNNDKTNVILGKKIKLLWGKPFIKDTIGDIQFEISPLSFFQVNPVQTKVIYDKALALADLKGNETMLDLYCGIGTISLYFAKHVKTVIGVEIIPQAVLDAKHNAELNHIENATFIEGAVELIIPKLYEEEQIKADIVIIDPPRKGCDEKLLQTIISMAPPKLIYISCDSATLARDLKVLSENGFQIEIVQPIDQFCMTEHIEVVIQMTYCGEKKK